MRWGTTNLMLFYCFLSFYVGNVVMNRTCNVVDNGDLDAEDRMVDKKDEEKKMSMAADNEM